MRIFNTAERTRVVGDSGVLIMFVTLVNESTAGNISERLNVI